MKHVYVREVHFMYDFLEIMLDLPKISVDIIHLALCAVTVSDLGFHQLKIRYLEAFSFLSS